jgi:hypothetical protein
MPPKGASGQAHGEPTAHGVNDLVPLSQNSTYRLLWANGVKDLVPLSHNPTLHFL